MKTKTTDLNGNMIVASGSYRVEKPAAQIDWTLAKSAKGYLFSASGSMRGAGSGQVIDSIAAAHPNDARIQEIAAVWRVYHLNDMKAGTPEQEAYLAAELSRNPDDLKAAPYNGDHYKWAVGKLKSAKLYEVYPSEALTDCAAKVDAFIAKYGAGVRSRDEIAALLKCIPVLFTYGTACQYLPIPAEIVETVKGWTDNAGGLSFYDRQAADFLATAGVKFRANLAAVQKSAAWSEGKPHGQHFKVTLSKGSQGGRMSKRLVFDYWGSLNDKETGKHPSAYDVLACISGDANTPETFADFCAEYGDDADSIKALQTFRRCNAFAKRLRAFFTADELAALSEIM